MAIYLVEGKIGSGKTYFAVKHLLNSYYSYDKSFREYFPLRPLILISNIEGLTLVHIDLKTEIEKYTLQYVFSEEYVVNLRAGSRLPVVFLIDEAQSPFLFHRKFYNEKVFFFFQYSRHFGVDVYMITQDVDSLAKELRALPELVYHAVSRTFGNAMSFCYKKFAAGEVVGSVTLAKSQSVFRVYKSFTFAELDKPKSALTRYAFFVCFGIVVCILVFKFVFVASFKHPSTAIKSSVSVASRSVVSVADNSAKSKQVQQPIPVYFVSKGTSLSSVESSMNSCSESSESLECLRARGRIVSDVVTVSDNYQIIEYQGYTYKIHNGVVMSKRAARDAAGSKGTSKTAVVVWPSL